ncbi:hypothetical protein GW17_00018505 [Ensete ventricosum]|nr:hypothetical protein GW17_00018505 [Ensete ventricosum]
MGGTYRFARLPVRGLSATGWYPAKNRPSMVDFGCPRSIEGEIDRRRLIVEEKGKKKKKRKKKKRRRRYFPHTVSPALHRHPRPHEETERLPARGERSR